MYWIRLSNNIFMRRLLCFIAAASFLGGCAGLPEGDLVGSVDGLESDALIIRQMPIDKNTTKTKLQSDTIVPYSGEKITLIDSLRGAVVVTVSSGKLSKSDIDKTSFVLLPGNRYVMKGKVVDGTIVASLEGSTVFGDDFAAVESETAPFKKVYDEALEVRNEEKMNEAFKSIMSTRAHYVSTHPESPLSVYYLSSMHRDSIISMFPALAVPDSTDAIASMLYASLCTRYDEALKAKKEIEAVAVGNSFVDFTATEVSDGKPFALGETIKGKKAIVYFWGRWCDNGDMERMKRFSSEHPEFVIVAVNYGDDDKAIAETIAKTGPTAKWHTMTNNNNGREISSLYKVEGYPYAVAIDAFGKIAGRSLNVTDEFISSLNNI